jgi:3-hydroxyacyl-[acyl-carrier-protein] dehydratase
MRPSRAFDSGIAGIHPLERLACALASTMHAALLTLPHGPSFRFVDSLDALVPGRSGAARYLLRGDEAFLAGHFPGAPLMPGVLLIEAIAQLGGIIAQSDPAISPLPDLRLAAVHNTKITGSAVPGETLLLEAEVSGRMDSLVQIEGRVRIGSRLVLTTRLTLGGSRFPPEDRLEDKPLVPMPAQEIRHHRNP